MQAMRGARKRSAHEGGLLLTGVPGEARGEIDGDKAVGSPSSADRACCLCSP